MAFALVFGFVTLTSDTNLIALGMFMKTAVCVENLEVCVEKKNILKKLNLSMHYGSIHSLMGPNGSGKSTLAYALMGHPRYITTAGHVYMFEREITTMPVCERAKLGLFLSVQQPAEIPGVRVFTFLKEAKRALTGQAVAVDEFYDELRRCMEILHMDPSIAYRNVGEGFSGGEKKRLELLQLLMLKPKVVILDEIDSGLDVDALKLVVEVVQLARKENPALSFLIITHYASMVHALEPDYVHIMQDGCIVESGDKTLAEHVEQRGYDDFKAIRP